MTRRGFLKGLGLLFLTPTELGARLLRGMPIRRAIKKSHWVCYRSPTGKLTPILGSGVLFLDYNYKEVGHGIRC